MSEQVVMLGISEITADPRLQTRAAVDDSRVEEFARLLMDDPKFEFKAVVVYVDGDGKRWLASGFHRLMAYVAAKRTHIPVAEYQGEFRDALLFALSTNATHGLPLTAADKRRKIEIVMSDPEWRKWSDAEVARRTGVRRALVAEVRATFGRPAPKRTVERNGTTYEMETPTARSSEPSGSPEPPVPPRSTDRMTDPRGVEVPDHLRDLFVDSRLIRVLDLVQEVASLVEPLATDHRYLVTAKVVSLLKLAREAVANGSPWVVCVACAGRGCDECRDGGLWPHWRLKEWEARR